MAATATDYREKFPRIARDTLFCHLEEADQRRVSGWAEEFRLTGQELRLVCERLRDLAMWGESFSWSRSELPVGGDPRVRKGAFLQALGERHGALIEAGPAFLPRGKPEAAFDKRAPVTLAREKLGLGRCPVASQKTRCCNLLTLDAVENCGFGCSYCSIQSFYGEREVRFDAHFAAKLEALELDPERTYHIGTGQSSDSLMWGNSHGVLEALWRFAETHPNVILELKSKSDNIAWLVKHPPPANVICTWSLNPQPLIEQEELGAASLARRLGAARAVADLGNLVGFHFHPMVRYQGWQEGYQGIAGQLEETFAPAEVALVSIGTLTFIKPVLKKLRREGRASRILQMPLVESAGKWSYPPEVKVALFRTLYRAFGEEWRERVFFYLCMEDHGLWQKVFGHEYGDNEALERAMIGHYRDKIEGLQGRRA